MARRSRKVRYIGDIYTHRELREMRMRLDAKLWYVEQKLAGDVAYVFSFDNLVELIAPPGSMADRVVGFVRMALATLRGVAKGVEHYRGRR
jgi:hypothetical protein